MAQFQWTVFGVTGKKYNVGLYHGDRTGHFLVHCNGKILLTKFYQKETETFTFFLDDELYELRVEKKGSGFGYSLNPNKSADTPMNRRIREHDRSNLKKTILFFGGLILIALAIAFGAPQLEKFIHRKNIDELFSEKGKSATAKFELDESGRYFNYFFVAEGEPVAKRASLAALQERGKGTRIFPLKSGDEFLIKYVAGNSAVNRIMWENPSISQIKKYKSRVLIKHMEFNPDFSETRAKCEIDLAFQIDSLNGIAHLFYQQTKASANEQFNSTSYQKFIRNEPFRRLSDENCRD